MKTGARNAASGSARGFRSAGEMSLVAFARLFPEPMTEESSAGEKGSRRAEAEREGAEWTGVKEGEGKEQYKDAQYSRQSDRGMWGERVGGEREMLNRK